MKGGCRTPIRSIAAYSPCTFTTPGISCRIWWFDLGHGVQHGNVLASPPTKRDQVFGSYPHSHCCREMEWKLIFQARWGIPLSIPYSRDRLHRFSPPHHMDTFIFIYLFTHIKLNTLFPFSILEESSSLLVMESIVVFISFIKKRNTNSSLYKMLIFSLIYQLPSVRYK